MADAFKILYMGGEDELEVKKSRFLAAARPVETEEEAAAFIAERKKKYWDASHSCSAFTIGLNHELTRCSDDGEPAQTAGRPILDVLLGGGVHNACVVVTRYFGGTLLGTGGLARAYSGAAKKAVEAGVVMEKRRAFRMEVETDYNSVGKIQYIAGRSEITILSSAYTDHVQLSLLIPVSEYEKLEKVITEGTNGRARLRRGDEVWYGLINKEVILLDR